MKNIVREIKQKKIDITQSYLAFRLGELPLEKGVENSLEAINACLKLDPMNKLFTLLKAHMHLLKDQKEAYENIIKNTEDYSIGYDKEPEVKGYRLYLECLTEKDEKFLNQALEQIKILSMEYPKVWMYRWFILYLNKSLNRNKLLKYTYIKEINASFPSPMMNFEAFSILSDEEEVLKQLSDYDLRIFLWSHQRRKIDRNLATRLGRLSLTYLKYNPKLLNLLCALYEQYKEEICLEAIILQYKLAKDTKPPLGEKYLLEGINKDLKIKHLYEDYLFYVQKDRYEVMQPALLRYFSYSTDLDDGLKAFWYGNILEKNHEALIQFPSYRKRIELFVGEQLEKEAISRDIGYLYEHILQEELLNQMRRDKLGAVLFKYHIQCNAKIVSVTVLHKELKREREYFLKDGSGVIDIYTDNYCLVFKDTSGNLVTTALEKYRLEPLIHLDSLRERIDIVKIKSPFILLYLGYKSLQFRKRDGTATGIYEQLIEFEALQTDFKNEILMLLIHYYYEAGTHEKLLSCYQKLMIEQLPDMERISLIEYLIKISECFEALKMIKVYGWDHIDVKLLYRLSSFIIQQCAPSDFYTRYLIHIFKHGKYDQSIVQYLNKYYEASIRDMFNVYQVATQQKVAVLELEERILKQMLKTDMFHIQYLDVFKAFYHRNPTNPLTMAFIKYTCYAYVIEHWKCLDDFFDLIINDTLENDEASIVSLGVLKWLSRNKELVKVHANWCEKMVRTFSDNKMLLPWFRRFKGYIELPNDVEAFTCISYISEKEGPVYFYYQYEEDEHFRCLEMTQLYGQLFTTNILVFYNEHLAYYICENEPESQITYSDIYYNDYYGEQDSVYDVINTILMSREHGDDQTLHSTVKQYLQAKTKIKKMFYPI